MEFEEQPILVRQGQSIDRMEDIGENPTAPLRRDSLGREHH